MPARRLARQVWLLFRKDLVTELRTRDTVVMLLFFSLLLVVIFAFSFMADDDLALAVTPGVLWVSAAFTGVLGIERSFAREQEGRTLTALVLVPGVARALFAAKMAINVLYMLLVEAFVVPLAVGMLEAEVTLPQVGLVAAAMALGTLGFAAVGTVFSAMLVAIKRRGVLLPIVLYPVTIPLLVMGVKAVATTLEGRPTPEIMSWFRIMIAVDVLYIVAGAWLFGMLVEED